VTRARLAVVGVLLVLGVLKAAPGIVLLAILTVVTAWLSTLWSRHGLTDVSYRRHLANDRAVWGELVDLQVAIENRKALPLAWVRAEDFVTQDLEIVGHVLASSGRYGFSILQNAWSLGPFERIVRHHQINATHRGRVQFDSVRLTVADLFGEDAASRETDLLDTLLIRPRTVPVRAARGAVVPLGARPTRRGLVEDPSLFAGVRPFQAGDARRRIHQRAFARTGRPLIKRFDPSTARQIVVALDIATDRLPYWSLTYDDDLVEGLAVVAASLARRLIADGAACGVAFNGWTYSLAHIGFVPPRAGSDQLIRIADQLARMSSTPSVPFERVLATLPARLAPGTLVLTISSQDPVRFAPALRRLRASGYEHRHVTFGPDSVPHAARARLAGIDAVVGALDPDWRTSATLTLAG
jgi:uncharacterized protein (DUF58 family)